MANEILALGCLYRLTFPNGKAYIGITRRTAEKRFKEHCRSAKVGRKLAINEAITKYGSSAVKVETLVIADWNYLVSLEVAAIAAFKTKGIGGYNLTIGGEGVLGFSPSHETREKLRLAQTGKKASEETILKMRASSRARVLTDELREKFRLANLGRKKSAESIEKTRAASIGRKMSQDQIEKLRARSIGRVKTASEIAKLSAANAGRVMTHEHKKNLSASATGRVMSKESIEKQWATRRAKAAASLTA